MKNYNPKYDFIYKKTPFVTIYPPHSSKSIQKKNDLPVIKNKNMMSF